MSIRQLLWIAAMLATLLAACSVVALQLDLWLLGVPGAIFVLLLVGAGE